MAEKNETSSVWVREAGLLLLCISGILHRDVMTSLLFLEKKNYKVTTCNSGTEAIDILDDNKFDIVFQF